MSGKRFVKSRPIVELRGASQLKLCGAHDNAECAAARFGTCAVINSLVF